jgi:hypothetical protein
VDKITGSGHEVYRGGRWWMIASPNSTGSPNRF